MDTTTAAQIAARITISAYGLDGAEIEDVTDDGMTLVCGNGQRFRIQVTEAADGHSRCDTSFGCVASRSRARCLP
jgi:hypothetical protein